MKKMVTKRGTSKLSRDDSTEYMGRTAVSPIKALFWGGVSLFVMGLVDTTLNLPGTRKPVLNQLHRLLQEERTFEDYLAYLPPIEIATTQVVLTTVLGSVYHTK